MVSLTGQPAGRVSQRRKSRSRIVAIIPAHNEEEHIARAIESLLAQTRTPDDIVVVSDNSRDATVGIASSYPVTVLETAGNAHRKSGALNMAWHQRGTLADIIVCIDGDTSLPPHAVADWEQEFNKSVSLGGSSSQPVMTGYGLLPRIQRAEFAKSATISLRRGAAHVISGTGCAFRGEALRQISRLPGQDGPWTYESVVEDYYLTYRMRQLGWRCVTSPTVWCWTGSMSTLRALWHQRIKWQLGTINDLVRFGINRLNWQEWLQQVWALACIVFWTLWLTLDISEAIAGRLRPDWTWAVFPVGFSVTELLHARRIRGRDWKDLVLAGSLVSIYVYTFLCMGWVAACWWKLVCGTRKDLWAAQYAAETVVQEKEDA
ncbi:MAG TPA: glycosyltransferase [Streptosporangiaceae bacterium]|nr:glycosyltransferase [Streptosporangiaceae bacterium]